MITNLTLISTLTLTATSHNTIVKGRLEVSQLITNHYHLEGAQKDAQHKWMKLRFDRIQLDHV